MKFTRLSFPAYGPFTDFHIELKEEVNFHLFYGPNEAGKSSILRGLTGLLYGIESRTSDDFIHPMAQLRVGAGLLHSDGRKLDFVRRKGRVNTLLSFTGEPLDDNSLAPYLGGVDQSLFERLYGLDHRTLVEGGHALLTGESDVGQSLFAAGLGPELRNLSKQLQQEASDIWRKSGRNYPLNQAISKFKDARKEIGHRSLNPRDWTALEREISDTEEARELARNELAETRKELSKLERYKRATHWVYHYRHTLQAIKELPEAPLLDNGFTQRRIALEQQERELQAQSERLSERTSSAKLELDALTPQPKLLSLSHKVDELYRGLDAFLQSDQRLKLTQEARQRFESEANLLARELCPQVPRSELTLPSVGLRRQAAQVVSDFHSAEREFEAGERALAQKQKTREELLKQLSELGEAPLLERLVALEVSLTKESKLDNEIEDFDKALKQADNDLQRAVGQLPGFRGRIEELLEIPSALPETIDWYEEEFQKLRHELSTLNLDHQRALQESDALGRKQEQLQGVTAPPTAEDLHHERTARDSQRDLLAEGWQTGRPWQEAQLDWKRFEEITEQADRLCDQLFAQAERVTQIASVKIKRQEINSQIALLEKKRDETSAQRAKLYEKWSAQSPSCLDNVLSPKEFRAWLQRLGEIKNLFTGRERLHRELESKQQARRRLIENTQRVLVDFEPPGDDFVSTVQEAIQKVQSLILPQKEKNSRRDNLQHQNSLLRSEIDDLSVVRNQLQARRDRVRKQWEELLATLKLQAISDPSDLTSLLDRYEQLGNLQRQESQAASDEKSLISERKAYRDKVEHLAVELEHPLEGLTVEQFVNNLYDAKQRAKTLHEKRVALEKQITQDNEDLLALQERLAHQTRAKRQLVEEAQASSYDALPEVEKLARHRTELQTELEKLEASLRESSAGESIELFSEKVSELDPDSLTNDTTELRERLERLDADYLTIHEKLGELRKQREHLFNTDGGAKEAATDAETVATDIREYTERYTVLLVAHHILNQQLEEYRRRHQGPILESAQRSFRALTLDLYPHLKTDYDSKDNPILLACEEDKRKVRIEGLSDGTRDQLFLALRLATIEQQLVHHEPVPFVADDLLVHFDSPRALAALNLFAEFSRKTQVLFFTHLERDRDLAQSLPPQTVQIHELPRAL